MKKNNEECGLNKSQDSLELKYDADRIPVGYLQMNLFETIKQVQKGSRKLITRSGRVVAVIASIQEIAMLDDLLEKQGELQK
jgi:hypothetical protein